MLCPTAFARTHAGVGSIMADVGGSYECKPARHGGTNVALCTSLFLDGGARHYAAGELEPTETKFQ